MLRGFSLICFLSLILLQQSAHPCQCISSFGACQEVGASDIIFIGTVESIEPIFMNRWYSTNQASMRSLNEAYIAAQHSSSATALARLKDAYLNSFPALAADDKRRLQSARTIHDVASLFDSTMDRGMRTHLRVRTLFKQESDDDDSPAFFDVWTSFDDF